MQARLDSIRSRILLFAVLAALIPSFVTAWMAYSQNKAALTAKMTNDLVTATDQAARELGVRHKELLVDLRVFAQSDEVIDNLRRLLGGGGAAPRARLNEYLDRLRSRFTDYEALTVLDARGRVVEASGVVSGPPLPVERLARLRGRDAVVGEVRWDARLDKPVLSVAVPVLTSSEATLGAFAVTLNLSGVEDLLQHVAPHDSGQAYLLTSAGALVAGSRGVTREVLGTRPSGIVLESLRQRRGTVTTYGGLAGEEVLGAAQAVAMLDWSLVVEVPTAAAFGHIRRILNITLLILTSLLAVVALAGYRLGLVIVRPLDRLTRAATEVAGGDLAVDLPVAGRGEVALLTQVFNDMVKRLRAGREELERLSITDGLTKLFNRRHLMSTLQEEARRATRSERPLGVLMLDVDDFKKYNDAHGHQAGDDVLVRLAAVLRECTREVDCCARYGGEEFVVLLPETPVDGAVAVAERIRMRLAQEDFDGARVTISVGAAEFPADGETPEFVMQSADAALYRAKHDGRNQVVRAVRRRTSRPSDPKAQRGSRGKAG